MTSNAQKSSIPKATVILAIGYAASGTTKLVGVRQVKREFAKWGSSRAVRLLIGTAELIGAGLLLSRRTAFLGATGLTALMIGATYTHLRHREYVRAVIPIAAICPLVNIVMNGRAQ